MDFEPGHILNTITDQTTLTRNIIAKGSFGTAYLYYNPVILQPSNNKPYIYRIYEPKYELSSLKNPELAVFKLINSLPAGEQCFFMRLLDYRVVGKTVDMLLEFNMNGATLLEHWLDRNPQPVVGCVLSIVSQISQISDIFAKHGWIHSELTPRNIIVITSNTEQGILTGLLNIVVINYMCMRKCNIPDAAFMEARIRILELLFNQHLVFRESRVRSIPERRWSVIITGNSILHSTWPELWETITGKIKQVYPNYAEYLAVPCDRVITAPSYADYICVYDIFLWASVYLPDGAWNRLYDVKVCVKPLVSVDLLDRIYQMKTLSELVNVLTLDKKKESDKVNK